MEGRLREWHKYRPEAPRFPDKAHREWATKQVARRDGGKYCAHCGITGVRLELDHITPWAQGGVSHPGNLELLCTDCNQAKADT